MSAADNNNGVPALANAGIVDNPANVAHSDTRPGVSPTTPSSISMVNANVNVNGNDGNNRLSAKRPLANADLVDDPANGHDGNTRPGGSPTTSSTVNMVNVNGHDNDGNHRDRAVSAPGEGGRQRMGGSAKRARVDDSDDHMSDDDNGDDRSDGGAAPHRTIDTSDGAHGASTEESATSDRASEAMDVDEPDRSLSGQLADGSDDDDSDDGIGNYGFTHSSEDEHHADSDSDSSDDDGEGVREKLFAWLHYERLAKRNPLDVLNELGLRIDFENDQTEPSEEELWKIVMEAVLRMTASAPRKKLEDVNTIDDVVRLIKTSKNIVILSGAGISVSCGIPDFRSKDGVYARLRVDFPTLPDPHAMFDIEFFRSDPRPFFQFAKELFPGNFLPAASHYFISMLDQKGQLLRNYTQNIDTLEHVAGVKNMLQCHGSFATASCMVCHAQSDGMLIKEQVMQQIVPRCSQCGPEVEQAIIKPDIVFFGEQLPQAFHDSLMQDRQKVDLLIVMGSSLKVQPVAHIPGCFDESVPRILINREPLPRVAFDVELLGNCDQIVQELCARLGPEYDLQAFAADKATETFGSAPAWTQPGYVAPPSTSSNAEAGTSMATTVSVATEVVATSAETGTTEVVVATATAAVTESAEDAPAATEQAENSEDDEDDEEQLGEEVQGVRERFRFVAPARYIFSGAELPAPFKHYRGGSDSDSGSDDDDDGDDEGDGNDDGDENGDENGADMDGSGEPHDDGDDDDDENAEVDEQGVNSDSQHDEDGQEDQSD
ncbi:SIR2 family histone deacetylase [Capsaspora owczarzaki ATCC 30864]|uniref:protein acetyllysine N-acetyltransferase n=1 Tax=Capsaspora owczarzaki (strain ATCC 30864) TaxID=595528 RepID=A0A0D2UH90_CAPO3|nr:SIR2 family histone deacetylase [Capsaspora owczarzaki ATCC 30864]KJE94481.1 SIR2 family histone deacetylase [Capsaspora owczarzaki ATCC 30864]|eukprot:XP_004346801.2 SIR2 family histone deacetylase [Capsaspora owczarzaki ATCC 30864]